MLQTNLILLVAFSCMLSAVSAATCGGCMQSNVTCVDETHYRVCINQSPIENGGILSCGKGKICTDLLDPCWEPFEGDGVEPVCNKKDVNCRDCDGSQLFVCTSRTTFQMCMGTELSPQINPCPEGTFCAIDSGEFCVKSCKLPDGKYECDKPAPQA
ncbi:uncharacterized protein LOC111592762 [Drosophila hydei]|uniref:Uncharacterized protein LOC111592762 n=1 Tax=Drosophila hydei TaxID=7224 RepID=A0A6J1L599_DROHY|nr:uncharacterized protein LOC111592762 [Drosophila hydei]